MKKIQRNDRTISINMDSQNLYSLDGIALDFNSQKVIGIKGGLDTPLIGDTRLEVSRARDNKAKPRKMVHVSNSPNDQTWIDSNHQLLSYDHLIAVDTNTNHCHGSTVSITAAYHVMPENHENGVAQCRAAVIALIEFWNVVEKPENLGWYEVLQAIAAHPVQFAGKVGLIVDSDLGNHQAFNKREMPIFGDFYLPENVTIVYASDKGGAEHLSTKMIKYCHDLASDTFKGNNLVMNIANLQQGIDGIYSHIRQWDTEVMDLRPFSEI
jgi:hypothetical protein